MGSLARQRKRVGVLKFLEKKEKKKVCGQMAKRFYIKTEMNERTGSQWTFYLQDNKFCQGLEGLLTELFNPVVLQDSINSKNKKTYFKILVSNSRSRSVSAEGL